MPPFTVFGVDPHMRTPYVQSYNFNVQQTLVEGTVLQVGYVGSKGTKLFRVRDINQAIAGSPARLQQRRPFNAVFPHFAGIYRLGSLGQLPTTTRCRSFCAGASPRV